MENLTPRELQVAQLVSSGLSNQEISDRLRISLQTVKNHMQAIYKKLGVKNRVELSLHFSEARKRSVHSGLKSKAQLGRMQHAELSSCARSEKHFQSKLNLSRRS
jgi:DNA-binding CsgD family transcriptional regulator